MDFHHDEKQYSTKTTKDKLSTCMGTPLRKNYRGDHSNDNIRYVTMAMLGTGDTAVCYRELFQYAGILSDGQEKNSRHLGITRPAKEKMTFYPIDMGKGQKCLSVLKEWESNGKKRFTPEQLKAGLQDTPEYTS
ncbi:MAG: hypothetical protein HY364_04620 [Candidatus Aenigmarchaeota archaeon]|nr:hypothetical protein [Candidatus Aenigmarchaeota archaeon]